MKELTYLSWLVTYKGYTRYATENFAYALYAHPELRKEFGMFQSQLARNSRTSVITSA